MRTGIWTLTVALTLACAGCPPATGIDDAEVIANPRSELSCHVRWTTAEATSSAVRFGPAGELAYAVSGEAGNEHEVLVIGMRPDTEYTLVAVSTDEAGEEQTSEELTFHTGEVPFADAVFEVVARDPAAMQPGWTLTNLALGDALSPVYVVMIDDEGYPVWYHQLGEDEARADVEVSLVDGDRVLIGGAIPSGERPTEVDLAGEVVWEGPVQPEGAEMMVPGQMHHMFARLDNGNYLTLIFDQGGGGATDVVTEMDAAGETVWSWNERDHLDLEVLYAQGNMALVDLDEDVAYYNARIVSTLYKVDRSNGDVIWAFGEGGDFAADPDAEHPWPTGEHAPEFLADGHLLLYDNGGARGFSRAVEYAIDTSQMTSSIAWQYPPDGVDDAWMNEALGDVDRLDNGNTLITAGGFRENDSTSRIMEVTADGTKVWDLRMFLEGQDKGVASYMSQRIPALVDDI